MRRSILLILPFSSLAYGWISNQQRTFAVSRTYAKGGDEIPKSAELETNDPCWQTMLDDDCSMGNIYSANFVASKWIKSMPCGEGIEDCDMPVALSAPETRDEAGVENVDVMEFLGLKRAQAINKKSNDKENLAP